MIRFYHISLGLLLIPFLKCFAVELSTTIVPISDGATANISLNTYNSSNTEDQAFTQFVDIKESIDFAIKVVNIPTKVSFIVVQIHVYLHNVTMSYSKSPSNQTLGNSVSGTNIGLFIETVNSKSAEVYIRNQNDFKVCALIAVVAYTNIAPYPGGCNMEFGITISPFQQLTYNNSTITVDAQPASAPKIGNIESKCEKHQLRHDAYRMYMPEQDFSNETYFLAIANMLTVKDIQKNADFIPSSLFGSAMRRIYSVYPGTGSVYCMVAHFANHSSAYVPIVTYGCDPSSWHNSCSILTTTISKFLCALAFFLGLFVTMRGQYYFKLSMFLLGILTGGYIGYTIGSAIGTIYSTGLIVTAICTGVLTSLIWLLLWMTFSSPIPSLIISGLSIGALSFYVFYSAVPVGALFLEVDTYYWLIFSTFIILTILILSVIPLVGNILCFTVLGAYTTVASIDYFSGSNLKYIIINGIRRATVTNFNVAVIQPPYQDKDILLTVFWAFLVILGLCKQCATNWNRAPFPPSTPSLVRHDEQAPLLGGSRYQNRYRFFNTQRYYTEI